MISVIYLERKIKFWFETALIRELSNQLVNLKSNFDKLFTNKIRVGENSFDLNVLQNILNQYSFLTGVLNQELIQKVILNNEKH